MNKTQLTLLLDTSVLNTIVHVPIILNNNKLRSDSDLKEYLAAAKDGKKYNVTFYSVDMI